MSGPAPGGSGPSGAAPRAVMAAGAVAGVPWMIAVKLVLIFVYFGISIVAVRALGKERYGLLSLCRNIVEYSVVVCSLGLNAALLRFIPELVLRRNRAGLRRLLWKTIALQLLGAALCTGALVALAPLFGRWFKADLAFLLPLAGLLLAAQILKNYLNDVFTALFRTRTVSMMSFVQAALWIVLLAAGLAWRPTVPVALGAQIVSIVLVGAAGGGLLVAHVRRMTGRSPPTGIGRSRTLRLSAPTAINNMLRMLMLQYSEVFFLGFYFTPAIVGIYDLGYSTPFVAMTLIPASLQTLFTSAFAEAHARDPDCLPALIRSVYKMLILLVLPLAAFGAFFAPRAIVVLYGPEMAAAGPVAAVFCLLHALPLISMPLSMAITAKERVLSMLPYMVGQVALNLLLDWLLIPRWGIPGAIAAVSLTFLGTIPLRLRAVRAILGSIAFPAGFCLRMATVSAALAGLLGLAAPRLGPAGLAAAAVLFLALYAAAVRLLRLLREADLEDLNRLATAKLARVLRLLAGPGACPQGVR